jgi:DNA-directed RNA polymerase specialized sigma24 family protein
MSITMQAFSVTCITVSDRKTAEDLTSMYSYARSAIWQDIVYRVRQQPFQAWLFQIAHNLSADHFRRSSIHPQVELAEQLAGEILRQMQGLNTVWPTSTFWRSPG